MYPVVLASGSPRRRELLKGLVATFDLIVADVDETLATGEDPRTATVRLAEMKAQAVREIRPDALVIAGDTLVAYEDSGRWVILGKPADRTDAARMLRALSGRVHCVTTGVCLMCPDGEHAFAVQTRVKFRALEDSEVAGYVATSEPLDKAGAYAIQGLAAAFVESIEGSRTNVVGLPIEDLEPVLRAYMKKPDDVSADGLRET